MKTGSCGGARPDPLKGSVGFLLWESRNGKKPPRRSSHPHSAKGVCLPSGEIEGMIHVRRRVIGVMAAAWGAVALAGAVPPAPVDADPEAAVQSALQRAPGNRESLEAALAALDGDARAALKFLIVNMPPQDLQTLPGPRLAEDVRLACQARDSAPWKAAIPAELFLNDVLPYACLDEARDPWRKDFHDRFAARIRDCRTPGAAALKLNTTLFKELNVRYHATKRPKPNQSPAESIRAGFASCTGLSILLVDACRAVGIPARIAGIPAWKDGQGDAQGRHGGNHTWVEVWDGRWHHLGAAESTALDQAWFTGKARGPAVDPSDPWHRIYATSFRRTDLHFILPWAPATTWIPAVDVTGAYR